MSHITTTTDSATLNQTELETLYLELHKTSDPDYRHRTNLLLKLAKLEATHHNKDQAITLLERANNIALESSNPSIIRLVEVKSAQFTIQYKLHSRS